MTKPYSDDVGPAGGRPGDPGAVGASNAHGDAGESAEGDDEGVRLTRVFAWLLVGVVVVVGLILYVVYHRAPSPLVG